MKGARIAAQGMLLMIGVAVALAAAPAQAGTYAVNGGCGNWTPTNTALAYLAIYGDCAELVVRNVGGPFTTPLWSGAYWTFSAPPGTVIGTTSLSGSIIGRDGWDARIFTETGLNLEICPSASCPTIGKYFAFTSGSLRSTQLFLRVICAATRCPNDKGLRGYLDVTYLAVNVEDSSVPSVAITGGDLLTGWRRGAGSVTLNAIDNVGIKLDRLLIDGTTREQRVRACQWGARIPCANGAAALSLDTTRLSDGPHTLGVQAVDAAGNVGGDSRTVLLDNTPPGAPVGVLVASGSEWRAINMFALGWRNPTEAYAPITTALRRGFGTLIRMRRVRVGLRGR